MAKKTGAWIAVPFVVLAVASTIAPRTAHAFCRSTTVATGPSFTPKPDQCWDQGFPLFWLNSCVGYRIQKSASHYPMLSYDTVADLTSRAFAKWSGAVCPTNGTGRSRVSIDIRDLGPADCKDLDYSKVNENTISFKDDAWPHETGIGTIALTTTQYVPSTGEILDADMEINSFEFKFTVGDPIGQGAYDLESVITHEAGHFLGLAHSADDRASMYYQYEPGDAHMRNLTSDDVAGICAVYRPDGLRSVLDGKIYPGPQCNPTPPRGSTDVCYDPKASCIGRVASGTPNENGWLGFGFVGVVGVLVRRVRRRVNVGA